MSIRLTGLLAVAFLVLTGLYYYFEIWNAEGRRRAEVLATRAFPGATVQLDSLMLFDGQASLTLEHREEGWRIVRPVDTPADQGEVHTFVQGLAGLERQGVMADSDRLASGEVRLADFGLDAAAAFVVVVPSDGERDTLYWGDRSPTGRYFYARRSSVPEVMTVRQTSWSLVDKGLHQLRDRRIAPIEPDSVRRVDIEYGSAHVAVSRAAGVWSLVRPVKDLGDAQAIDRLLRRLSAANASAVAAERAEAGANGTDRPRLRIEVDQGPALGTTRLLVGDRTAPGRAPASFAVNPDLAPLFVVDSTLVADLMKSASDLRYKQIFGFPLAGIDRVRLEKQGQTVECRHDAAVGHWVVDVPKMYVVLEGAVETFIDRMAKLSAKAFVADRMTGAAQWGLDAPAARFALWRGDALVREVRVGVGDRHIYAKADHRPEVVELEPREYRLLDVALVPVRADSAAGTSGEPTDRSAAAAD